MTERPGRRLTPTGALGRTRGVRACAGPGVAEQRAPHRLTTGLLLHAPPHGQRVQQRQTSAGLRLGAGRCDKDGQGPGSGSVIASLTRCPSRHTRTVTEIVRDASLVRTA